MTRLRAQFHFDIGEIWVRSDELGAAFKLPRDHRVQIGLPGSEPPFVLAVNRHGEILEQPLTGSLSETADHRFHGVRMVSVVVSLEADLSAAAFETEPWPIEQANAVWRQAFDTAHEAFEEFRSVLRTAGGQYWIAMSHDVPQLIGLQVLEDLDAGKQIPVSCPFPPSVAVVLTPDELQELPPIGETVAATASVDPVSVADTLLADARAVYWPAESRAPDHQRAVLLAAIAAEVRVKAALLELASPELDALVRVVIDNPREVTQSVPQLLHKTLDAITGRSLHEAHRELWKGVERLFRVRNRVAHDAYLPNAKEGRDAVGYARLLFDWLDELVAERR